MTGCIVGRYQEEPVAIRRISWNVEARRLNGIRTVWSERGGNGLERAWNSVTAGVAPNVRRVASFAKKQKIAGDLGVERVTRALVQESGSCTNAARQNSSEVP